MRKILFIAICALFGVVSCSNIETLPTYGDGEFRIVFNTGMMITKSDLTPSWEEGSAIFISAGEPDLVILVADESSGNIIGWYPSANATLEADPTSTSMAVSITGLGLGGDTERDIVVYAFANTEGLWATEIGGASTSLADLKSTLATSAQVESLMFTPLAANTCPTVKDIDPMDAEDNLNRLPLSAKGTTTIAGNGNGEIALQMLRCVAKVTSELVNNTGDDLTMYGFHNEFIGMCPTSGLVVPGSDPDLAGSSGNLIGDESELFIARGGTRQESWYVFPSTGPYTCNVHFWLDEDAYTESDTTSEDYQSYSSLEVHDDHARDLLELKRNQHLHIVTRISKGLSVSFSFQVMDWTPMPEEIYFH